MPDSSLEDKLSTDAPLDRVIKEHYTLKDIVRETPSVKTLKFRSNKGMRLNSKPGTHVFIGTLDSEGKYLQRAYSLASAPGSDTLEFYINMIGGRLTSLLDKAKVGDTFYVTGPTGNFYFTPSKNKKSLFLAAGTGIAPFIAMLRYIEQNRIGEDVIVLYSVKDTGDIIMKDYLTNLQKNGKIKLVITLTHPTEKGGWNGELGRIDAQMIRKYVHDAPERRCYVCGSEAFNKDMKEYLKLLTVNAEEVKIDQWGH